MASIFEQTIVPKLNFSNFPLHEWQLVSCNFGQLVPVYVREVLPNDVFSLSAFQNINFAPMVAPMYHEVKASLHFFYVPDRLVWEGFETFITGCEDGHVLDEADIPAQPGIPKSYFSTLFDETEFPSDSLQGSIFDYIGLPNQLRETTTDDEIISDIPLRDYFLIWYEYYRDENLQASKRVGNVGFTYYDFWKSWKRNQDFINGDYDYSVVAAMLNGFVPFYRSYRKDYFRGALPSPQKGEPVTLSLGTSAPVNVGATDVFRIGELSPTLGIRAYPKSNQVFFGANRNIQMPGLSASDESRPLQAYQANNQSSEPQLDNISSIQGLLRRVDGSTVTRQIATADLTQASAITVEALREAFAVQEILESLSMRGSRYVEFLRGNFGTSPDDYKLQRPQFIGGIVSPVQVQSVIQTSGYSGDDERDQTGYAAGRAFAVARDRVFRMRFKEHGYIIGIASIMPKDYYYQGIPRHFLRKDRFDYYLPQTAHLGEQAIENQELFYTVDNDVKNHGVFGFIPRWAEYKTSISGIHGDFRGSLKYYHMATEYESCPSLSEDFITTKEVQTRPFAVWQHTNPEVNHLIWSQYFFKVVASRPMPYHSVPKVI